MAMTDLQRARLKIMSGQLGGEVLRLIKAVRMSNHKLSFGQAVDTLWQREFAHIVKVVNVERLAIKCSPNAYYGLLQLYEDRGYIQAKRSSESNEITIVFEKVLSCISAEGE
jgi:hypothetical protein